MRVLVTGGAGYIGSVVVEELLNGGHEPIVYDNLSKGHRRSVPDTVQFVEGDILNEKMLTASLREHRVEAVIHMAASSLVGESVAEPAKYYWNNVVGSLTLLNAMHRAEVRKIVFSSTAAVYGEPAKQPIEENDPTVPTNPYGQSKLAFEEALRWYASAYDIRYASLRYFNAAGASFRCGEIHDPETHLIPLVLQAASGRRPYVEVFGDDYRTRDGTCIRDYVHVRDLANAHVLALSTLDKRSGIFNLGCGGEGYTVSDVITCAREVTGKEISAKLGPRRAGDPAILIASSNKIRSELGWEPRFQDLRKIVASAWEWQLKHPRRFESD
jgi:UDP-glucose 4-epimerase